MAKVLIIRFSSFGDVLQTLSVAGAISRQWPKAEIHWVTRAEFAPLIQFHPAVRKVWSLQRENGIQGLNEISRRLRAEGFTHIYDAHNNLRSRVIVWGLAGWWNWRRWLRFVRVLRRPIYRWRRFLLFRFRINHFEQPFNGQRDLLQPLRRWGINAAAPPVPQLFLPPEADHMVARKIPVALPESFVALAPSAAYSLKRWPLYHWGELIARCKDLKFVVLGGPADSFLSDLVDLAPERVINLAGKLNFIESASVVAKSRLLVSNDTGLLHVAEQLGQPCIALMGPAPFGFPSRPRTRILQLDLACRPCSKHGQGPCVNPEFHKCLVGISPIKVESEMRTILGAAR